MNLLEKPEARKRLKELLPVLSRRDEAEGIILRRLLQELSGKERLIFYVADPRLEVDVLPLTESTPLPRPSAFWEFRHPAKYFFPKVNPRGTLSFVRPHSWERGQFGLWEPIGIEEISPEEADLILVPALGFSETGERLGRGAGYYDRTLSSPAVFKKTIGLTFSAVFPVPFRTEEHDQKVGKIITETSIHSFLD
ncbi:5-formyltetrahydrofolate cyclo-ligase [Leptospira ryugenii]|uniref:5-formyltetrahydrofolate cyclo-ligase n=1 Tax=Leptospira ryugenii TaxID=1917863 RepID=A0A2P2DYZ8_9LEPT|nr:5-formyltetrahydrofolate cyclo-ligase [Leptospira ryugenii]GBF49843.1 5-formyltetrahydrofolate cyclo-ligase [Leptospira ryugenii]